MLVAACGGGTAADPPTTTTPPPETTIPPPAGTATTSSTGAVTTASSAATTVTSLATTTATALAEPSGVIYFTAVDSVNDGTKVMAFDVAAGVFSDVTEPGGDWEEGAHPSPDGARIGYWSWNPATYYDDSRVWVADRDGANPTRITDVPSQFWGWLPGGSGMVIGSYEAFRRERGIGVVGDWALLDLATGAVTLIVDPEDRIEFIFDSVVSPDGTTILFDGFGDEGVILSRYDVATFEVTVLTTGGDAAWSPDGSTVAFSREGEGIWLIGADGTGERFLVGDPATSYDSDPVWSPDGTWIAFVRWPFDAETGSFWVIRPDGSDLRPLSPEMPGDGGGLSWGP
jgi:Tol biopolymer transport system component